MTPLPKKKHTKSRTGVRRGSETVTLPNLVTCKHCGKIKIAHSTCPECGKY